MREDELRHKVYLYSRELLQKIGEQEKKWMQAAIGFTWITQDGKVNIDSGIIDDIGDWPEVYRKLSREKIIEEFKNRDNWEKWRNAEPALIADLEKGEAIAKELALRNAVNLRMTINKTKAQFLVEIDTKGKEENELLEKIYHHVGAMFEAWRQYMLWYNGEERRKISTAKKKTAA